MSCWIPVSSGIPIRGRLTNLLGHRLARGDQNGLGVRDHIKVGIVSKSRKPQLSLEDSPKRSLFGRVLP